MIKKHVILANDSRLLREALRRVISKADHLEVVQEILNREELPSAIERLGPVWVILSCTKEAFGWIENCMAAYPAVRFIVFSPDNHFIRMKWQDSYEEDLTNISLKEFIHILEKDLQHI